ncbi:MFS transporter [Streptacidiphilus sp. MAP5-3]|uniref:MFS transporter n=1 Tax=unclassified Streptacidiphilus TaxID=2643834 RepID=UPI00351872C4
MTPSDPGPDPRRWLMLPVVLLASFMAQFDTFVVNVAAPSLRSQLHAGDVALELIVGGYAFTYGSGMVTGGRLGDIFSHRRMFLIGLGTFSVASLLCGLAVTPGELVVARMAQGLTGALMVPQILALITAPFAPSERPRTMAWFGVTAGLASVAGQVLGGMLLDANLFGLGWRVIFLINVPVGAVTIACALRLVPRHTNERRTSLDLVGALGVSTSLALILVPLMLGRDAGWPVWTWVLMIAALPAVAATLAWERRLTARGGAPLLDLKLFSSRSFTGGLIVNIAFMAFFGSFIFTLTLLLQSGLGLSALAAGLTFTPLGVLLGVTSVAGRPLVAKYGLRVLALGAAISAVGVATLLAELHQLGPDITVGWMLAPLGLVGLGNGLVMPALMGSVLAGVPQAQAGAAAGVLTTSQQFANATGVALLGTVLFGAVGAHPTRADFTSGLQITAGIDIALLLATIGLTLLLPKAPAPAAPAPRPAEAAPAAGTVRS